MELSNLKERLFYKSYLIRKTEETIENLFELGLLKGTMHGGRGQEALPSVLSEMIDLSKDYVLSGHRSHGLFLSFSDDITGLLGELMGKKIGYVEGKGGSQHMKYKNLMTNGITGGMVPSSVGIGFKCKYFSKDSLSVVVFGDGAINEGYVLESLNMASALELPVLFIMENNTFAMSTITKKYTGGEISERIKGFGINYEKCIAINIMDVYEALNKIINSIRIIRKPFFMEILTHRFSGHSKSDKREYVPKELDEYWENNDFLKKLEKEIDKEKIQEIKNEIIQRIEKSVNYSKSKE